MRRKMVDWGDPFYLKFWVNRSPLERNRRFWTVLGVRNNVRCSYWAHWKARSALPISDNWTFFTRCYGWGAIRAKIDRKSVISLQRGQFDPKFYVEGVALHQTFFFSGNYAKCSFVRYKNLDRSFFRFVTIHAFVRRTAFFSLDRRAFNSAR